MALVNLALVTDELRSNLLCQPFGPELPGHPFRLTWSEALEMDPDVAVVRSWLLDEAAKEAQLRQ